MMLLLSGIGVEVASVLLMLKESQSDAVELKLWMKITDLYCKLTVKFIHIQSMTNLSTELCEGSRTRHIVTIVEFIVNDIDKCSLRRVVPCESFVS